MKTTRNRILPFFLALALLCGAVVVPASAATSEAQNAANSLYQLGLFQGVGTLGDGSPNFALDNSASRAQAAVMLVRLLGAEQEALSTHYSSPFTDAGWAKDYIGYVYAKNITKGVSNTKFGADSQITAAQFLTLVLRALGYSDVDYRNPYPTAKSVGLTYPDSTGAFRRGDIAVICYNALSCRVSGTSQTLRQQLEAKGVIKNPAEGSAVDLQAFYAGLCSKYEGFNANMVVEGEFLAAYYAGLSEIPVKQQVIYMPMLSTVVCEIALVEVKNAADVQAVKAIFQARIDYQTGANGDIPGAWYPASVESWKSDSRVVSNGNYVMLIAFPEKVDQIVADFNKLF